MTAPRQAPRTGLFGSSIGTNMLAAATAEIIGTFVLVYGGTAVAVAAVLDRPVAGPSYNSVATPLAFGLALLVVAVVDAVAIGIGLAVLGVPLAVPLAALVFLGAFIPIIGAVIGGGVAVLIALVANGPIAALIVLGIIVAVMQLEGHVLQPLLLGHAVKLHPLAVVLAIAAGLIVAGIAGALFAVPLLAVLNSGIRSLRSAADEHVDPDDVHTSAPEETDRTNPARTANPNRPPTR